MHWRLELTDQDSRPWRIVAATDIPGVEGASPAPSPTDPELAQPP